MRLLQVSFPPAEKRWVPSCALVSLRRLGALDDRVGCLAAPWSADGGVAALRALVEGVLGKRAAPNAP